MAGYTYNPSSRGKKIPCSRPASAIWGSLPSASVTPSQQNQIICHGKIKLGGGGEGVGGLGLQSSRPAWVLAQLDCLQQLQTKHKHGAIEGWSPHPTLNPLAVSGLASAGLGNPSGFHSVHYLTVCASLHQEDSYPLLPSEGQLEYSG